MRQMRQIHERNEMEQDEWSQHVSNVKKQFPGREYAIDQIKALMGEVRRF